VSRRPGQGASRRAAEQAAADRLAQPRSRLEKKRGRGGGMKRSRDSARARRRSSGAQRRQVDAAQQDRGRPRRDHLAQGTDHAPPHPGHPHRQAAQFIFVDTPGYQTQHQNALNRGMNRRVVQGATGGPCGAVIEASPWDERDTPFSSCCRKGSPVILVLNKVTTRGTDKSRVAETLRGTKRRDFAGATCR
jgi:hypothetical protein